MTSAFFFCIHGLTTQSCCCYFAETRLRNIGVDESFRVRRLGRGSQTHNVLGNITKRSIPRRGSCSQGCHYDLLRLIGTYSLSARSTLARPQYLSSSLFSIPPSSSSSYTHSHTLCVGTQRKKEKNLGTKATCYSLRFLPL